MLLLKISMILLLIFLINVGFSYNEETESTTTAASTSVSFKQTTGSILATTTTKNPEKPSFYDYVKFILGKIRGFIGFL
jgi:hypothetical protein